MLILASASPRRRELLAQAGFAFEVRAADICEEPLPGEDPIAYVVRLAREKAQVVFDEVVSHPFRTEREMDGAPGGRAELTRSAEAGPSTALRSAQDDSPRWVPQDDGLVVLGADTTVTLDGVILGKPEDAGDAARMLRMLSGRTHRVITGVAVVSAARCEVAAEVTAVRFLTLSDAEIEAYIATGEPMDKAGAYAIQGRAAKWIPRIEGDYCNVVGLPLALVSALLEGFSPVLSQV
ncbi:MAG: Maf family protein [Terracidiphilus sp.]|jgi:septum formation protein